MKDKRTPPQKTPCFCTFIQIPPNKLDSCSIKNPYHQIPICALRDFTADPPSEVFPVLCFVCNFHGVEVLLVKM